MAAILHTNIDIASRSVRGQQAQLIVGGGGGHALPSTLLPSAAQMRLPFS